MALAFFSSCAVHCETPYSHKAAQNTQFCRQVREVSLFRVLQRPVRSGGAVLVAALRTARRLAGGSRGFSSLGYIAPGPTFWDFATSHWWKFSCFFGGLGPFRPPNSAKLFLGQPHYSGLRKKKSAIFFFDRQWVQTPAKPRFIEIELGKKIIFDRKKIDPTLPRNLLCRALAPCSAGQRRSGVAIRVARRPGIGAFF